MASTYSPLKIELIATGEQVNTWGDTTNTNLGTAIEEAIGGTADVTFSSANVTLTLTDSNASQTARNLRLNLTGTSGGARTLTVPNVEKSYIINNGLADAVTVQNSTGTTVAVAAGKTMEVFSTGTGVKDVTNYATTMALGSPLPVTSGGTGVTTLTANNVILGNGTSNPSFVAPGANGNVLTSNGTTWVSSTPVVFVTGMIMLWSGSIASIPAGWVLCDGTNSTPDLRSRFVVGAGSTYSVNSTGGTADAIVVSHTHTATVTDPGHNHTYITRGSTPPQSGSATPCWNGTVTDNTGTATTGISVGISTTGASGTNANLPPYYALAYIMKT